MKNKKILLILLVAIVIVIVGVIVSRNIKNENQDSTGTTDPVAALANPTEITLEFYNNFLEVAKSPGIDPYQSDVFKNAPLTNELKESLTGAKTGELDPVFCQPFVPPKVVGKALFTLGTEAQIMIMARGTTEKSSTQAVVDLVSDNGNWVINKITCANGEVAPEKEYAFENEGYLLQKSVPAPYDPSIWHIVFEQDGKMGYVTPLFFTAQSICINYDNSEEVCNPDSLREAMKVLVQADMSEAGATVKRLTLLQD